MKKLMIDMDDVICIGGFIDLVNEYLNTTHDINNITNYYVQDLMTEEEYEGFAKYFYNKNLYDYTVLSEDVVNVIKRLNDMYDIYIVTAYILKGKTDNAGNHINNKYNYLTKTFPFLDPHKFIFTSDKSVVRGDIVIDDRLSNLYPQYKTKLLFTSYHNKNITEEELNKLGVIRVNNFKEIEALLTNKI